MSQKVRMWRWNDSEPYGERAVSEESATESFGCEGEDSFSPAFEKLITNLNRPLCGDKISQRLVVSVVG